MRIETRINGQVFECGFDAIPWDKPSNELISENNLPHLRDDHPQEILEQIAEYSLEVKTNVAMEIALHGNWQKAAIILREIYDGVDEDGKVEIIKNIKDVFLAEILFTDNILALPKNPEQIYNYLFRQNVLGKA